MLNIYVDTLTDVKSTPNSIKAALVGTTSSLQTIRFQTLFILDLCVGHCKVVRPRRA